MTQPTFSVNEARFKQVLEQYANASMKAIRDTYNARMLDVLIKAYMRTPELKKGIMQQRLGEAVQMGYRKVSGTPKTPMSRAALLALHNAIKRTGKGIGGQLLREAGQRVVLAKLRAAKFLKSGWVPALKVFNRIKMEVKNRPPKPFIRQEESVRGKPKGDGTGATEILHPMAWAENRIHDIDKLGRAALEGAFKAATARMEKILRGELEEVKRKKWDGKVVR